MQHAKPATVRLGVGGVNHTSISYPPRATNAWSDTLGPLEECSGLRMVHMQMVAAVESFIISFIIYKLDSIPGTRSPGDEPGNPAGEKKLPYFQSIMFTELFAWWFAGSQSPG